MASCSFSTLLERVTACGFSSCYPGHVEVVSLKECTRHISRHLQLQGLSADKAVDSEFKLLFALPLPGVVVGGGERFFFF